MSDNQTPPAVASVTDYVGCRYGSMFAFADDDVIGRSLRLYGEWSEHEISVLDRFVRSGSLVLDVGANIGSHTLAFAKRHPDAFVWGFEPRPLVSSIAWTNCVRNGAMNAAIVSSACGAERGEILLGPPMNGEDNVGGYSLQQPAGDRNRGRARSGGIKKRLSRSSPLTPPMTRVEVSPLDAYAYPCPVSLLKIDVEGMEGDVLIGARETLAAYRPAIFFEMLEIEALEKPFDALRDLDYRLFWLETHQFNRNNFRGDPDNIWYRTEMGVLALPSGAAEIDLPPVTGGEDAIPFQADARAGIDV